MGTLFGLHGFGVQEERHRLQCPAPAPPLQRGGTASSFPAHFRNTCGDESLGWMNALFAKIWPHVDNAARRIVQEQVVPQVKESLPSLLQSSFKISKFTLGNTPPVLGPITFQEVSGGARLKIEINFDSSVDIALHIGASAGVRSLKFSGSLVLRLGPFIDESPVVGGVNMYFLNRPRLELDFTGLGNIADAPMVAGIVRRTIDDILAASLVLPNSICVPLATEKQGVDPVTLKQPLPLGVVRVQVVEAHQLLAKDVNLLRAGTSDPYVKIKLSSEEWKSSTIEKDLNPVWPKTEFRDFAIMDSEQIFFFEVFDEDRYSADDLIGVSKPVTLQSAFDGDSITLPLYPRLDSTGPGDCGNLTLKCTWYEPTSSSSSPGSMVAVRLKHVSVPHGVPEVSVVAEYGGVDRSTLCLKASAAQAAAAAVDAKLAGIVHRCSAEGIERDVIARLTELDASTVGALLDPPEIERTSSKALSNASQEPKFVKLDCTLYIPNAQLSTDSAPPVNLTVKDKKGRVLGKASIVAEKLSHGFEPKSISMEKPDGGDSGLEISAAAALHGLAQPETGPEEFAIGTPGR